MTTKYAAWIITLASIGQILGYLYALPGHIGDPTWSPHAQFHLELSWIWLIGLDIAMLILAWGPLQRRERWAWWTLGVLGICAQGGHFMASLAEPAGRPAEPWYDWALGAVALIFALGLGVGWRALARPAEGA